MIDKTESIKSFLKKNSNVLMGAMRPTSRVTKRKQIEDSLLRKGFRTIGDLKNIKYYEVVPPTKNSGTEEFRTIRFESTSGDIVFCLRKKHAPEFMKLIDEVSNECAKEEDKREAEMALINDYIKGNSEKFFILYSISRKEGHPSKEAYELAREELLFLKDMLEGD